MVKISNFVDLFCVNNKLLQPKSFTGVFSNNTKGLWKVWGKTASWFPIQPPKNLVNLFRAGEKVKISNFIGLFFPKGKLVEPQNLTGVSCPDTEGLWKVWGKTQSWFAIKQPKKLGNFFRLG